MNARSLRSARWLSLPVLIIPLATWMVLSGGEAPLHSAGPAVAAEPPRSTPPVKAELPPIRPDQLIMISADYQQDVAKMLNLLRDKDPRCWKGIDPTTAGLSADQPNRTNPVFFVHCGAGAPIVVRFSWMDAVNGALPDVPLAISQRDATRRCEEAVIQKVGGTVEFSRIMDSHYVDHGDGRATYGSTFESGSVGGYVPKFKFRCRFSKQDLADVSVKPLS